MFVRLDPGVEKEFCESGSELSFGCGRLGGRGGSRGKPCRDGYAGIGRCPWLNASDLLVENE